MTREKESVLIYAKPDLFPLSFGILEPRGQLGDHLDEFGHETHALFLGYNTVEDAHGDTRKTVCGFQKACPTWERSLVNCQGDIPLGELSRHILRSWISHEIASSGYDLHSDFYLYFDSSWWLVHEFGFHRDVWRKTMEGIEWVTLLKQQAKDWSPLATLKLLSNLKLTIAIHANKVATTAVQNAPLPLYVMTARGVFWTAVWVTIGSAIITYFTVVLMVFWDTLLVMFGTAVWMTLWNAP